MCLVHCFQNIKTPPPPSLSTATTFSFRLAIECRKCLLVLWLKVHLSSWRILIKNCTGTKRLSFELSSVGSLTIRSTLLWGWKAESRQIQILKAYLACVQFITLSICLDEVANLIKLIVLGVFIVNPLPLLWMKLPSNSYSCIYLFIYLYINVDINTALSHVHLIIPVFFFFSEFIG
jgi:hypothetical protein